MAIQFKKPDFGNSFTINNEAIVRKSMGGDTLVVVDSEWPSTQKMSFTISGLSEIERDSFIQFYAASAGQELVFIDHENVSWRGFLTSQSPQIVQYGRNCQYKTTFDFEGVRI